MDDEVQTNDPESRTMVQVYFVTIGGRVYTLLGPVTYLPELGIDAGLIEAFETGDIIPAAMAAGFLDGSWSEGQGPRTAVH